MTVGELIEKLKAFNSDIPVMIECEDHSYSGEIAKDALELKEARLMCPKSYKINDKIIEEPPFWVVDEFNFWSWPEDVFKQKVLTIKVDALSVPATIKQ